MAWRRSPECVGGFVYLPYTVRQSQPHWPLDPFPLDSPAAQTWLADPEVRSFTYKGNVLTLTVRKERLKRGGDYWYAYARLPDGKVHKRYVGKTSAVTLARLHALALALRSDREGTGRARYGHG
jgi:hypothetical protein